MENFTVEEPLEGVDVVLGLELMLAGREAYQWGSSSCLRVHNPQLIGGLVVEEEIELSDLLDVRVSFVHPRETELGSDLAVGLVEEFGAGLGGIVEDLVGLKEFEPDLSHGLVLQFTVEDSLTGFEGDGEVVAGVGEFFGAGFAHAGVDGGAVAAVVEGEQDVEVGASGHCF